MNCGVKPKDCTSKWFAPILYHINPVCSHVCLFGVLRSTQEFFTHIGTSLLSLKGFVIMTYTRHSWPLSSKGSLISVPHLLWHGASVDNGHLRGHVTLTPVAERLYSGAVTICYYDRSVAPAIRTLNFPLARRTF